MEKDEDDLYHLVADELRIATKAEVVAVFIEREGQLIRKAINGLPQKFFPDEVYPNGGSIVGRAFESSTPIVSKNVQKDLPYVYPDFISKYKNELASGKFEHVIASRFYSHNFKRPFGVLRIVNKLIRHSPAILDHNGFEIQDVEFLSIVSQLLADSIELQWRVQRNRALLDISQLVVEGTQNEAEIYEKIAKSTKEAFRVDQAGVAIYVPDKKLAYVAAQYPKNPSLNDPTIIFSIDSYKAVEELILSQTPIAIEDAQMDIKTLPAQEIIKKQGIKSFLLVPLVLNGKVIGSLGLDSIRYKRKFYQDELDFAYLLAKNTMPAIEKARSALATRQNERNLLAERMHDIKDEFLGCVKLPLITSLKYFERQNLENVYALIKRVVDYTPSFYSQLDHIMRHLREDILVEEGLGAALQRYVETLPQKCCTLKTNYSVRLPIQLEYELNELAQELIINAIRYGVESRSDGQVTVSIHQTYSYKERQNGVLLVVSDNGKPWDNQTLEKLVHNELPSIGAQRLNGFAMRARHTYKFDKRVKISRRFPKSVNDKAIGLHITYWEE